MKSGRITFTYVINYRFAVPFIVSNTKHISSWKFWIICMGENESEVILQTN